MPCCLLSPLWELDRIWYAYALVSIYCIYTTYINRREYSSLTHSTLCSVYVFSEGVSLVGLVVRHLPQEWHTWVRFFILPWIFFPGRVIPISTLPDAWCYRVSAGTGWSGVGILCLLTDMSLFSLSDWREKWESTWFANCDAVCCPTENQGECTDINECDSQPCEYGATCLNEVNAYSCVCVPGYSGNNCETNIDECAAQPCQNNAS